ncbi:hypothetical protein ZWY2020_033326 [Hordeum vulgare]|nr:hypothetical protein ZWY2020_033326 [Hordeum vulgare]
MMVHEIPVIELIVVAMWYIWWQRRQGVKGQAIQTPQRTTMSIRVLTTNFIRNYLPNHPTRKKDYSWQKSDPRTIKISVDASFYAETRTGACGAVARDHVGNFIATATWVLSHVSSADSAEITAIYRRVLLASNIGCTKVTLESDSMNGLAAMESPEVYMGPDVTKITEATILSLKFPEISFIHCNRDANLVAHSLAKYYSNTHLSQSWEGHSPDFILPHIAII